ncbi:hypothetical protein [Duganella sp. Dugasp56]|jgi:uncharacterized membrane protein YfcA|uniref:hypothetical protein n=1 Tax=unclassified Duganella TaxID=2636909 RepID=UPI00159D8DAD
MKDGLLLLLTAIACSVGAWLFFKYLGNDAFSVIMLVTLVCAIWDNARLRRKLRDLGYKPEGKRTWF